MSSASVDDIYYRDRMDLFALYLVLYEWRGGWAGLGRQLGLGLYLQVSILPALIIVSSLVCDVVPFYCGKHKPPIILENYYVNSLWGFHIFCIYNLYCYIGVCVDFWLLFICFKYFNFNHLHPFLISYYWSLGPIAYSASSPSLNFLQHRFNTIVVFFLFCWIFKFK